MQFLNTNFPFLWVYNLHAPYKINQIFIQMQTENSFLKTREIYFNLLTNLQIHRIKKCEN